MLGILFTGLSSTSAELFKLQYCCAISYYKKGEGLSAFCRAPKGLTSITQSFHCTGEWRTDSTSVRRNPKLRPCSTTWRLGWSIWRWVLRAKPCWRSAQKQWRRQLSIGWYVPVIPSYGPRTLIASHTVFLGKFIPVLYTYSFPRPRGGWSLVISHAHGAAQDSDDVIISPILHLHASLIIL